jgi:hypothetical protein
MATPLLSSPPLEGLDKGTPFPLLFILAFKILSRLFLREELRGNLKGIRIAKNSPPISHLWFADDLIIFVRANSKEVAIVKSFLETYSAWSGQGINTRKSSMKGLKLILWKISWTILQSKVCISSLLSPSNPDLLCPLCKSGGHSLEHIFLSCAFACVV